jgi:putative membrane protein
MAKRPGLVPRLAKLTAIAVGAAVVSPERAFAHGDRVSVSRLGSAWEPAVIPLVFAVVALALFGQAFVRLRRRGRSDHAPVSRVLLFALGVAILTLALVSPLDTIAEEYLLWVHMAQHVLIGDVAPALLMLAVRGPLTFFLLPTPVLRPLARLRPLRPVLHLLLRPSVSFGCWASAVAAWHVPVCYDYALGHRWAHDLEHASFILAGCLVWAQLVDPARRGALTTLSRRLYYAGALFLTGHVLVHPILFAAGAVYRPYREQDERLLGLSPLADQHLAGLVMTVDQVLTLGTFVLVLLWPELMRKHRRAAPVADSRSSGRASRLPASPTRKFTGTGVGSSPGDDGRVSGARRLGPGS